MSTMSLNKEIQDNKKKIRRLKNYENLYFTHHSLEDLRRKAKKEYSVLNRVIEQQKKTQYNKVHKRLINRLVMGQSFEEDSHARPVVTDPEYEDDQKDKQDQQLEPLVHHEDPIKDQKLIENRVTTMSTLIMAWFLDDIFDPNYYKDKVSNMIKNKDKSKCRKIKRGLINKDQDD